MPRKPKIKTITADMDVTERYSALRFYREKDTGDYLCADHAATLPGNSRLVEGRATAIANDVGSVCTTMVDVEYLEESCTRVPRARVPAVWLRALGI